MTSPNNTDSPSVTVPWGKSEYVSVIAAVASLLNGYLGQDYGLGKNAQAISLVVGALILASHNLSRALKHRTAIKANTDVVVAQIAAQSAVDAAVLTPTPPAPAPAAPAVDPTLPTSPPLALKKAPAKVARPRGGRGRIGTG